MISSPQEVVITGVGVVSPIGIGYEAMQRALVDGTSGVRPLAAFDSAEFPIRIGAEVIDFDPKQFVMPRKSLKVMSRGVQLAFASAQMAISHADLAASGVSPDRLGVVFGAEMFYLEPEELIDAFRGCITDHQFVHERWDQRALGEMYPLWMLKYLPNMPACHIAIAHDARGPNNTIVLAEASSLQAVAEGVRVIERGHADVMIVGGAGTRLHPMSWIFRDNVLHARRTDHPAQVSRPFDAHRDGMVYGEGSASFVLESRRHAEARRTKILARVMSSANAFEACTPGKPFHGHAIRSAIAQCLRAARIEPGDLGHVNAHGLSTIHHDAAESRAIRETLGDVPVTALKSFFGNLGAGGGAVEMIGSLVAIQTGQVPYTLNYEQADPNCPINVVKARPYPTKRTAALLLNQTSMGQSVALVLCGAN